MKKVFFVVVFLLVVGMFGALLPYPVFSSTTNITHSDEFQINNFYESEFSNLDTLAPKILPLTQEEVVHFLDGEFQVFDLESGQSFYATRIGGQNHADIEPTDKESALVVKKIGQFSQKRRPALVKITETAYVPASVVLYPHGYEVCGTLGGHLCLHFYNSKTDGTQKEDYFHQKAVKMAEKLGKKYLKENNLF